LAVQENCIAAVHLKEDEVIIGKLLDHYYEINAWNWSATELSLLIPHCTPAGRAQQPGMTGQVKEIFLAVLVSSELMLKTVKLFSIQDY
jgi:hypothetical protein